MENAKTNPIITGTIWKEMLRYFFPILIGTFFQQLYNIVDAAIVGQYTDSAGLAAVGNASATIINLFLSFFLGLGAGATVVVAQRYGANDDEQTSRAVHTVIALSLVAGLILMGVGLTMAPIMLVALGTTGDVLGPAKTYLNIYFWGIEPVLLFNIGSGVLRAVGDSKRPLYYLAFSSLIKIALDFLFIAGLGMGVTGAGISTLIAETFSAALLVARLMRVKESYRLIPAKIGFDKLVLGDAFRIGLPSGLQSMMYAISNILILSGINHFGTNTVAAWSAYSKVDALFWMTINAFGVTVTTFVSQNFGARKLDRMRKCVRSGFLMALTAAVSLSVILGFSADFLMRLFSRDETVIATGVAIIHEITPLYFTYISIEILSGALRGSGESANPMLITIFGICVMRIAWLYGVFPFFGTIGSLVISYPFSWALTSVMFLIYYLRGNWLRRQLLRVGAPMDTVQIPAAVIEGPKLARLNVWLKLKNGKERSL